MKYLSSILNTFPKVFCQEMNKIKILGLAVYDVKYYKAKSIEMQPYLFMLIDYNQKFITTCRQIRYLVDEYPYDLENLYVLVFKVPEQFETAYEQYLIGNYSQMYTKSQLKEIKIPPVWKGNINPVYLVLTKDDGGIEYLKKEIEATYKTKQFPENPKEYDLPPRIRQEVFNWKDNEDFVKQNTPLKHL